MVIKAIPIVCERGARCMNSSEKLAERTFLSVGVMGSRFWAYVLFFGGDLHAVFSCGIVELSIMLCFAR